MKMLGLNPMEQEIIDLTNNISRNIITVIFITVTIIITIAITMTNTSRIIVITIIIIHTIVHLFRMNCINITL